MEWKRIFQNKRFLIMILVLYVLCIFLFYREMNNKENKTQRLEMKQKVESIIDQVEEWESTNILQYLTEQIQKENEQISQQYNRNEEVEVSGTLLGLKEVYQEVTALDGFSQKVQSVLQNEQQMELLAVFQKDDGYGLKNIKKTARDYEVLLNVHPKLMNNISLNRYFDFKITDFVIIAGAILTIFMFLQERKRGIWEVVNTTKRGRCYLAIERVGILALLIGVFVALFHSTILLISIFNYGAIDVSLPVQSITRLQDFTYVMSIGQFLIYYFIMKYFYYFMLALLIWLVLSLFRNTTVGLSIFIFIFGVEYTLFNTILSSSGKNIWKYINIAGWMNWIEYCQRYQNVKLFSYPIEIKQIALVLFCIFTVVSICALLILAGKRKPIGKQSIFTVFFNRLGSWISNKIPVPSLFALEARKLFWMQRGIWILLILLLIQIQMLNTSKVYYSEELMYRNYYYKKYEGLVTDQTLKKMEEEEQSISRAIKELSSSFTGDEAVDNGIFIQIQSQQARLTALKSIMERGNGILALGEKGVGAGIVNPIGYQHLFGKSEEHKQEETIFMGVITLCLVLGGICSLEKQAGTYSVIKVTKKGSNTQVIQKILLATICAIVVSGIIFGFEIYEVSHRYGLFGNQYRVTSISFLESISFNISIGQYVCIIYGLRTFMMILVSSSIVFLSSKCKTVFSGIAISLLLFVLPSTMYIMGISIVGIISVVKYIHI